MLKLPASIKVALWLGLSAALTAVGNGLTNGTVAVAPEHMWWVNLVIVTATNAVRAMREEK